MSFVEEEEPDNLDLLLAKEVDTDRSTLVHNKSMVENSNSSPTNN